MKRDVLLVANYWHFEFEKKSSRYRTMAEVLCDSGYDVEVVTSNFRHQTKMRRNNLLYEKCKIRYKITLLHEPEYTKNISLKRLRSHHILAKNMVKYLDKRKKPDLIIVSVPSLAVGSAITRYANRNGIKVVIDIQDLWPEAFKMVLNVPVISDCIFAPMMHQANRIYARADKIMAVSNTYVDRAIRYNKNDQKGTAVYIGSDGELINLLVQDNMVNKPTDEFWIGYIGALGHSYDIKLIIDAISSMDVQTRKRIVFKVMGDGVLRNEFETYAKSKSANCDFLGFVEYGEMMCILQKCDIAVNPIVGNSVSSIINKVSDYAMGGIPVINTQKSDEYRNLLELYNCGINCEPGNAEEVKNAIEFLLSHEEERKFMGKNAKQLAREKFDRTRTYQNVVRLVDSLLCE